MISDEERAKIMAEYMAGADEDGEEEDEEFGEDDEDDDSEDEQEEPTPPTILKGGLALGKGKQRRLLIPLTLAITRLESAEISFYA